MIVAVAAILAAASPPQAELPTPTECAAESDFRSKKATTDPDVLRRGIEACPWTQFYLLSAALMRRGEMEEASLWFYIGQMRGRAYVRCHNPARDGHPALLASLNSGLGEPINLYLYGSIRRTVSVIDRALAWEAANPDPALPLPKCADAIEFVRNDKRQQREWTISHADEVRERRTEAGLPNEPD